MSLKAFKYPKMSTIRLTKTNQVQHILNVLRALKFPLLDDTEIIKAIVSEYYSNFQQAQIPQRMATEEESKAIKRAKKEVEKGEYKRIPVDQVLTADLF